MSDNGAHVTWRELNLALGPIKDDVSEIKADVKALRTERESESWLGARGRSVATTIVAGALLAVWSAGTSAAIALLIH